MKLRVQIDGPQNKKFVVDKNVQQALAFHGQAIFNKILAKVPNLQDEEPNFIVIFDGTNYKADFSGLSEALQNQIKDAGFDYNDKS